MAGVVGWDLDVEPSTTDSSLMLQLLRAGTRRWPSRCQLLLKLRLARFIMGIRARSPSAAGAAVASSAVSSSPASPAVSAETGGAKRPRLGRIDLDDRIAQAKLKEKTARAAVKATRAEIRNEKRRRARLVKKAAALSVADLEQIAKLKKAGLWDPLYGVGADAPDDRAAASPAASGVAAALVAAAAPPASVDAEDAGSAGAAATHAVLVETSAAAAAEEDSDHVSAAEPPEEE